MTANNLRQKFEKRITSVKNADFDSLQEALSHFWAFFENEPTLREIKENLINQFPNISNKVYQMFHSPSADTKKPESELESTAIAFEVLYKVVKEDGFRGALQASVYPTAFSTLNTPTVIEVDERYTKVFKSWYLEKFHDYVDEQLEKIESQNPEAETTKNMPNRADPRKVFVVHGRNLELRDEVCSFLTSINLDPMEWGEARRLTGKPNPYIGEILKAGFDNAQAILVLFTPDDEAKLLDSFITDSDESYEKEFTPQPRQNVIFEAGMAWAMCPERTVLVQVGRVRPMSDLSGLHIPRLNNSTEMRQELAGRLKDAGCDVKIENKTKWHKEGNFELAQFTKSQIQTLQTTGASINPDEIGIKILKILAQNERFYQVHELASTLELKEIEIKHHLFKLEKFHLIRMFPKDGAYECELISDGLNYVVENKLHLP